jgi:hypothetical protein
MSRNQSPRSVREGKQKAATSRERSRPFALEREALHPSVGLSALRANPIQQKRPPTTLAHWQRPNRNKSNSRLCPRSARTDRIPAGSPMITIDGSHLWPSMNRLPHASGNT